MNVITTTGSTILLAVCSVVFMGVPPRAIADPIIPGYTVTPFASIALPRGVTFDSSTGNLFTMDRDAGTVFQIAPTGAISTVTDLPDLSVGYVGPHFDPVSGNLFVSEFDSHAGSTVLQITTDGVVSVFASGIPSPHGLTTDSGGNLFVSSFTHLCPGSIFKVTPGGEISPFASGLCDPDGVVFGPGGDLFIGDRGTNRIMRVPSAGGPATEFASGFNNPIAVTFDSMGNLYVANFDDGTLSKVSPTGVVSPFGNGFANPVGIVFDTSGNLFVADFGADLIYKAQQGVVNDFVTFDPFPATFTFKPDPTVCPAGFVGTFSFEARLTNISESSLTDLVVAVTTLTNGNLLQNAHGGPGGVSSRLTVPQEDGFSEGVLSSDEFVDVPFIICLTQRRPFQFFVDVLGIVDASIHAQAKYTYP
ncbi:MAG: hypothetical protein ND866_13435 [Pyrinomonadaceae bacterium]|nr:hypothetical protein [Pyrinomonadaceae bacterium]